MLCVPCKVHSAIGTIDRLYTRDDPPKLTLSGTTDPAMKLVDKYFQILDKFDASWMPDRTVTQWGKNRGGIVLWTGPRGNEKAKKSAEKARLTRKLIPFNRPTKTYIGLNLYLYSYTDAGIVHMF